MGTTLVYSTALLLLTAIAARSNAAVSTIPARTTTSTTTTTTTPATKITSTLEATIAPKSKRGVVEVGTNVWANNGGYQSKQANPITSSTTVNQNSESQGPQRIGTSPSAYSQSQNNGRTSAYNNQNSGYRQAPPYSTLSYANVGESYGNSGQAYGPGAPSFGNGGQSYVSSPQNYGSTDESQNSADLSAFYAPLSQASGAQGSLNFGNYQETQPLTSSGQTQNSQGGQVQNGAISTPYYTSFAGAPSAVKIFNDKPSTGQYGASFVQLPTDQQNVYKSQSMYAPNHQSSSYMVPGTGSYPYQQATSLSQGSAYPSQGGPVFAATSQIHRNTLKTNYPGLKGPEFAQIYAPHHQSASTFVPSVQSNGFGPATVDFNGKKIPLPVLQLQSAEDFPGFTQAINTAHPLLLETNTPFQGQNEFGFLADFAKSLNSQGGNIVPFLNPQQSNQPQVLPVRSANGSPQFPQYKGARINTSPNYNQGKPAPSYEPLNTQPQLHFTGKPALPPAPAPAPLTTSSIIHHPPLSARPVAEIRDDVEVIKKKRPPPPPHDFDDDDVDEGYKAIEREYGRQQDDAEDEAPQRGKHFKESNVESDFKPSKGFPFKSYDEQFHKYSKPSSDEESEEERPASRYRHSASAEEDDDYDGYSSTHHADYRSPKARPSRYEDDAEESQRHERQDEAEEDEEHQRRPSAYNAYGKDFEQEFEDSYRRELPKTKYVHIKEVPEIDEPSASTHKSHSSSDSSPKSSKYRGRKGYHQSHDEDPEESKSYISHTSHKHGKAPKNRDSEGYSPNIRSYNKGQSPKVIHEESFGYKAPDATGYSKYKKSPTGDSYSSVKKSPKMDSYLQASRSSYKSPKNDNAFENGDSYSYTSGGSWKSDKKSPETSDFHGHGSTVVKTLALPEHKSTFHASAIGRGNFFLSRNDKIVRDLTGI